MTADVVTWLSVRCAGVGVAPVERLLCGVNVVVRHFRCCCSLARGGNSSIMNVAISVIPCLSQYWTVLYLSLSLTILNCSSLSFTSHNIDPLLRNPWLMNSSCLLHQSAQWPTLFHFQITNIERNNGTIITFSKELFSQDNLVTWQRTSSISRVYCK